MNSATYIKSRVEDQINWMEGKSKWNQTRYKNIKVMEIVAAAIIPLLAGYQPAAEEQNRGTLGIIIGLLGVFIVILTSVRQLNKYQENWLTYRTTLEALKAQKFLFEASAPPYDDAAAFPKFVMNCESLLAKENESWKTVWSKKEDEVKIPPAAPQNPEIPDAGATAKDTTAVEPPAAEDTTADKPADVPATNATSTDITDNTDAAVTADETDASAEKEK